MEGSAETNWDVDTYKSDHEPEHHWALRRKFLETNKGRFPEDRLVCLAQTFANIEFMGCRYVVFSSKNWIRLMIFYRNTFLLTDIPKKRWNWSKNFLLELFKNTETVRKIDFKGLLSLEATPLITKSIEVDPKNESEKRHSISY
jgi:hypothetical protein